MTKAYRSNRRCNKTDHRMFVHVKYPFFRFYTMTTLYLLKVGAEINLMISIKKVSTDSFLNLEYFLKKSGLT